MSIRIHRLVVTGSNKQDAILDLEGKSHLVFGPTDTGKSYILECLRYCLGSSKRPRGIGYSEGYTLAGLQVSIDDQTKFTLFRDFLHGEEAVYENFHDYPPTADASSRLVEGISELLLIWAGATNKKILTKSGKLSNFSASALRYLCLFDEIETLDKVPLEGKDRALQMRNRSAIALAMSSADDSNAVLVATTDQRNVAKGHAEAIEEEILSLSDDVSKSFTAKVSRKEIEASLSRANAEIDRVEAYFKTHAKELSDLKAAHSFIEGRSRGVKQQLASLKEAQGRFALLDSKYESDIQRLQMIYAAAEVVATFETRPCPLCKTDLSHQEAHVEDEEKQLALRQAAVAEVEKIDALRRGLAAALSDIQKDILGTEADLWQLRKEAKINFESQSNLVQPLASDSGTTLSELIERKSVLSIALKNLERVEYLTDRLTVAQVQTKRVKQVIERNIATSASNLCTRISLMLKKWNVPGVDSVFYDESTADLFINNRERISYGKGKRGIFLTAYVVALMEQALEIGSPHLGVVAIDSPVVTYKDPKHGSMDQEEVIDPIVKDRFYTWLADRKEPGQVIILENEEPPAELMDKLLFTEFVGSSISSGRSGFFPA